MPGSGLTPLATFALGDVMSGTRSRSPRRSSTTQRRGAPLGRGLAIIALLLGVLGQEAGNAADDLTDALPYSLSYTVTGDYAVGSVDLVPSPQTQGFQTGTIHMGRSEEHTSELQSPCNLVCRLLLA